MNVKDRVNSNHYPLEQGKKKKKIEKKKRREKGGGRREI